jgi:hypothetical protein
VVQYSREREEVHGTGLGVDERAEPLEWILRAVGRTEFGCVVEADGCRARRHEPLAVHVVGMVTHRDEHVPRITADDEVRHVVAHRQAVEGRVGLDEPAMGLVGEQRSDVGEGTQVHVQPRRDAVERVGEHGSVEHEERHEHLRPRRPALGRCADDDVAGAVLEPAPPLAVGDERSVGDELVHVGPPVRDTGDHPGTATVLGTHHRHRRDYRHPHA